MSFSLSQVRGDISSLRRDVDRLPSTLQAVNSIQQQYTGNIDAELSSIRQIIQLIGADVAQLKQDRTQAASATELTELKGYVDSLKTRADNVEENIALITDDVNAVRGEIYTRATKDEINTLLQDVGQLKGVDSQILSNLTTSWQELNQVRNKVTNLENDDLDMEDSLRQLQQRTEDLDRELGRLSQGATDLERTVSEMRFEEQQVEPVISSSSPGPTVTSAMTSRLIQNVTVMSSRLDQLRNDVRYLQGQSITQGEDLIQLHQDFREFSANRGNFIQRPSAVPLSNETLQHIQNSTTAGVNNTIITLLYRSLQQLQLDNNFIYQNVTGLHRQFSGVRSDFADVVSNVNQFQADLDELQWNNAQLYYDVVDLQEVKDVVNSEITTLRQDISRINDNLGIF